MLELLWMKFIPVLEMTYFMKMAARSLLEYGIYICQTLLEYEIVL